MVVIGRGPCTEAEMSGHVLRMEGKLMCTISYEVAESGEALGKGVFFFLSIPLDVTQGEREKAVYNTRETWFSSLCRKGWCIVHLL